MAAVGSAFSVDAEQRVALEVVQTLVFAAELLERRPQRRAPVCVRRAPSWQDPGVGERPVFDQQDVRVWPGAPELAHQRGCALADLLAVHVRQAVDHERRGVEGRDVPGDRFLHAAVAGEAEVDDLAAEHAGQDGRPRHAWPAGAGAVRDRGAVDDDRLGLACRQRRQRRALGDAELEPLDAVVERQVERELSAASRRRCEACAQPLADVLTGRARHADPAQAAAVVAGVEVDAADARRRHVEHRERRRSQAVAHVQLARVGGEPRRDPCAVAGQVPDRLSDLGLGGGGQAVEGRGALVEGAALEAPVGDVDPAQRGLGLRVERGGSGRGEREQRGEHAGDRHTLMLRRRAAGPARASAAAGSTGRTARC